MKTLQIYFNPKSFFCLKKQNKPFFASFCYSPASEEEKKFGSIYIIAEINYGSKKDKSRLQEIAEKIKNKYYDVENESKSVEESFKRAIEQPFSFESGLSLMIFSVRPDLSVLFSKIGDLKLFIFRQGEMFNIGDNPSFNSGEKNFSDIMQGQFENNDLVLAMNKDLFDQFWENKLFSRLKYVRKYKDLKKLFKEKKQSLNQFFGILVVIFIKKRRFSLFKIISLYNRSKTSFTNASRIVIDKTQISQKIIPKIIPKISPDSPFRQGKIKKGVKYAFVLLILLILGYLIF